MSHNIHYNEQTEKHSFFSVKEKPWHGLGQIVENYPNSAEALQFAGLDYTVEKRKLFTLDNENHNGKSDLVIPEIEVPNYYATVRTDNDAVLGVVGENYEVVQNTDAFSFFDSIVGGDGIQYETAGALGKGQRIFITAKLPNYIKVGSDDLIERYLFLTTSHNGYGSITAVFTPTRIVCANTLNAALHNCTHSVKIRHTQNAKQRLEQAHLLMGISNNLSEQLEEVFNRWSAITVKDEQLKKLIQLAMAPNKVVVDQLNRSQFEEVSRRFTNSCDKVIEYAHTAPSQQMTTTKGTLFGVYNSVTGFFQNVRSYKSPEAKLDSLLFGGIGQMRGQKAFDLCADFAAKGAAALN